MLAASLVTFQGSYETVHLYMPSGRANMFFLRFRRNNAEGFQLLEHFDRIGRFRILVMPGSLYIEQVEEKRQFLSLRIQISTTRWTCQLKLPITLLERRLARGVIEVL